MTDPERTDLFGNAIKPTVVQPSLFERSATDAEMFAAVDRNAERLRRMTDAEDKPPTCELCGERITKHNPMDESAPGVTCRDCTLPRSYDAYPNSNPWSDR